MSEEAVMNERDAHEREVEDLAVAMHQRDYAHGRARYDWGQMQEGYREDCRRHARAALDRVRGDSARVRDGVCLLCGSGVLTSGEHVRDDLPPCFGHFPASVRGDMVRAEDDEWHYTEEKPNLNDPLLRGGGDMVPLDEVLAYLRISGDPEMAAAAGLIEAEFRGSTDGR